MSDELTVTVELRDEAWSITGEVSSSQVLPSAIFAYENSGENTLGVYYGVCSLAEYQRFPIWEGVAIPKFGNRFVRHTQAKILLPLNSDVQRTVDNMVNTAKTLKTELQANPSTTTVYPI